MKTNRHRRPLLLAGLSLGFSLNLCLADVPVKTASTPESSVEQAKLFRFRFRPRVGQERVIRLHCVQTATQVLPTGNTTMRQTIAMDIEYHVASVSADGLIRLRTTVVGARLRREVDGETTETYDSAKPPKDALDSAGVFDLMQGLPFMLQMKPDGSIAGVENKALIVRQMMDKMKFRAESRKYLGPILLAALEGNAFKNFGNMFASFPAQPVGIGDSWPKRDVVSGDYNLIYDGNLEFAKRSDAVSTLHLKSVIKPDPNRDAGAHVFPVRGNQSGYYFVENATGWTQRARLEQRWTARTAADGQFVEPNSPADKHALYMKITFDIGTLKSND